MERGGETTPSAGLYGERGAGGKLRRPPSRKPPSTPYSRPPPKEAEPGQQRRRWLSNLVDPAYRLISGGANRLFLSFFSNSNSIHAALPAPSAQPHVQQHAEAEQSANSDEDDHDLIGDLKNGISGTTKIASPSEAEDRLESGSGFHGDQKTDQSDGIGLSEIEQLLKGKKFSRDEVNHLMEIINSRAAELPTVEHEKKNQTITAEEKAKRPVIIDDFPKTLSEEKQEDLNKSFWGTSTPLPQLAMRDEVGASPIEIARAYMGSRTSEIDLSSKNTMSKDERAILHANEFSSEPFIPTPSKRSIGWPGSMVQDQRDYSTPQTERGRFGLHNFPRTPYSRTIFSKSKSELTQLQSGNDKAPRALSTSLKQLQTPIYGQPRGAALDGGYGSVGPIRRMRQKVGAQTPSRGSPSVHSSAIGPSLVENSNITEGFLPAVKKSFELGGLSGNTQIQSLGRKPSSFEVGAPNVHPQSSKIARIILEHIDRNPPTPKDKSEELKLAFAWKKPPSSGVSCVNHNGHDSLPHVGGFSSSKLINQDYQKNDAHQNADKGNYLFKVPPQENTSKATDVLSNGPTGDGRGGRSLVKSKLEDFLKITPNAVGFEALNQQKKPPSQPSGTKRVFPSISVDKPDTKWTVSSGNSSGFTFPVSASCTVLSEPPTPSIMPSFLASSSHHKDGDTVPTYDFGSKKSAPLVFSFPSTPSTSAEIQNEASDIKFSFGSDKPTLSFGSIGKDTICY